MLRVGISELTPACGAAARPIEEALRRVHPVIPERVCSETLEFDYKDWERGETLYDVRRRTRDTLHKLMRLARFVGEDWLMEVLELERESAAAQALFVLEDFNRRYAGLRR